MPVETAQLPGKRRRVRGWVTSAKMAKTIVVTVPRTVMHPLVEKYIRRQTSLVAHDENRQAGEGDEVLIEETRPLSKTKRWRLIQVLRKSQIGPGGIVPASITVEGEAQARRAARKAERAAEVAAHPEGNKP